MLKTVLRKRFRTILAHGRPLPNCTKSLNRITKVRIFEQGHGYTMNFYYTSRLNFVLFLA